MHDDRAGPLLHARGRVVDISGVNGVRLTGTKEAKVGALK